MSDDTVTPLRRRKIEEVTIRQFSPKVQKDYLRHVKNFAIFLGRSPDKADLTISADTNFTVYLWSWRSKP